MFIYKQPLETSKYKALNKDRYLDSFFATRNVGQCQRLFNEYYKTAIKLDRLMWEKYYNEKWGWHRLDSVFNSLKEYCFEKYGLTEYETKKWIFHRVIGQTWNGLIKEEQLIKVILRHFPKFNFQKTDFDVDKKFCIDWEMYKGSYLALGLQIKPISYLYMKSEHQLKVKAYHKEQNEKYKEIYAPYEYVYYDKEGLYKPQELFKRIKLKLNL